MNYVKQITLSELKELVEQAIKKHGGDKKVKCFNYRGEEISQAKIVEFQSDKGSWLELS